MGQSAERIDENVCPAPGRGHGRDEEHQLPGNPAKTTVDPGLVRKLLFGKANSEARESSLQSVEPFDEVHASRLYLCGTPRNLELSEVELIRCTGLDSPSKTLDWGG